MLTAEARVETSRPARYLAQLCQHLSNKGRHLGTGNGGPSGHRSEHSGPAPAEQVRVEWTETDGTVTFPGGHCAMQAGPEALLLRAEATDAGTLEFIENLITSHLGRFSHREPLTVTWQRTGA
jgi:hypothetical protein